MSFARRTNTVLGRALRFPGALWLAVGLALGLSLPSVLAEFYCDDQGMVLRLDGLGPSALPGPFHLYTFLTGAAGERAVFVDRGPLPWWMASGLKLSFFRPLSSALFALDHALAGHHPFLYHLHSIAWYAIAVLIAAKVLRRVLPEREAALAALLFAVAPAHWMLAAWPSARHVAISGAFALAALGFHLRSREHSASGNSLTSVAALACAALGLGAGETALGVFGYVAAYEAIGRRDSYAARLRALAPWGVLLVAYAALYEGLGCGVAGSGAYVDPIVQPGSYLALLPARLAVFANAALLCVPSELSSLGPRLVPILAALGVAASLAFAALLRRALRRLSPEQARTLAWLLVGAGLATLPGAAGIPGDRVLFLPNLAVAAALAVALLNAGKRVQPTTPVAPLLARIGVAWFALVHVVLAPLSFAFGAATLASTSHAALAAASKAEIPARARVKVLGIGLSDPLLGMYLESALWIAPRPEPRPREVHLLSMSAHDHVLKRLDERTLEIDVLGGTLLDSAFEAVFRPANAPLKAGSVVPLGAWSIHVLEDVAGRPARFAVAFDRPVDDPSLVFLIWKDGALRALNPPKIGQQTRVLHELGPMGI